MIEQYASEYTEEMLAKMTEDEILDMVIKKMTDEMTESGMGGYIDPLIAAVKGE